MAEGYACQGLTVHAALHLCRPHKHTVHCLHHILAGPLSNLGAGQRVPDNDSGAFIKDLKTAQ